MLTTTLTTRGNLVQNLTGFKNRLEGETYYRNSFALVVKRLDLTQTIF